MKNPYLVTEPTLLSFSGGRSSGYLLSRVLQAHGGVIPDMCHVCFANTGKEHEATLQFVHEVEKRWCPVVWLEFLPNTPKFVVVNYETASRAGEPFAALIRKKKYLPNPVTRFCTSDLKVKPMKWYLESIGIKQYATMLGLRADEPRRVSRITADLTREMICPMSSDGATKETVLSYWQESPFDLKLPENDAAFGNCDLCFLKGIAPLERVVGSDPSRAQWWSDMETEIGGTFRSDRPTYHGLRIRVESQGKLFVDTQDNEGTLPCDCTD